MPETENIAKYEAFYIVAPTHTDAKVSEIAEHFKEVVEKNGGKVSEAGKWDKRKLAYPIDDLTEANYILMYFESPTEVPKELDRLMRISDDVLRHRIYKDERPE
ncbi:MAG: 30S ribosomal protein S6 [Fimbriimonadaceae bacterium]